MPQLSGIRRRSKLLGLVFVGLTIGGACVSSTYYQTQVPVTRTAQSELENTASETGSSGGAAAIADPGLQLEDYGVSITPDSDENICDTIRATEGPSHVAKRIGFNEENGLDIREWWKVVNEQAGLSIDPTTTWYPDTKICVTEGWLIQTLIDNATPPDAVALTPQAPLETQSGQPTSTPSGLDFFQSAEATATKQAAGPNPTPLPTEQSSVQATPQPVTGEHQYYFDPCVRNGETIDCVCGQIKSGRGIGDITRQLEIPWSTYPQVANQAGVSENDRFSVGQEICVPKTWWQSQNPDSSKAAAEPSESQQQSTTTGNSMVVQSDVPSGCGQVYEILANNITERYDELLVNSANLRAALNLIALIEHYGNTGLTNRSYCTRFGNTTFSGNTHPGGGAAGRYQFLSLSWSLATKEIGIPYNTFNNQMSQHYGALYFIENKADVLELLLDGQIEDALPELCPTWPSLPPGCRLDQGPKEGITVQWAVNKYNDFVQIAENRQDLVWSSLKAAGKIDH